ncbi:hypothetical protein [Candidatus Nitrosotalea okcheonensis]|uniref:Uncharacterized protein n=1 Tax=Candidatus Nitrosotalea okcheonensis TaxID=1903276 RepID=A0A2H1FCC3_9ARCH|nr:hypothetical protein [Candidatus Nitrosotalea okcheonensis]SMH70414.1 exported protein of unknown function [Candidatus Nitrosotalea okcheonensis]
MILSQMTILVMVTVLLCSVILTANVYASGGEKYYPIVISRGDLSSSQINILIHAPDFNSNSYALDTIGVDGSKVTISTRESSISYKLVETGPDTGDFAGYVILSSTTSVCSPVCGPTDGFLAAGGNDDVTVSFTYATGHTVSATSNDKMPSQAGHSTISEFPYAEFVLVSMMSFIMIFKMNFIL